MSRGVLPILVATLVAIGGCGADVNIPAVETVGTSGLAFDSSGADGGVGAPAPVVALTPINPLPGVDTSTGSPLTDLTLFPLLGFGVIDDLLLSVSDDRILELLTPSAPLLNTSQTFLERTCRDGGDTLTFCRQRFSQ